MERRCSTGGVRKSMEKQIEARPEWTADTLSLCISKKSLIKQTKRYQKFYALL